MQAELTEVEILDLSVDERHTLARKAGIKPIYLYETLMERAGDPLPSIGRDGGRSRRLAVFAIDDLTAEEEEELLKYLAFLRRAIGADALIASAERPGREFDRGWKQVAN